MREYTIHYVDAAGKQIPADKDTQFDPRLFEQAIHGLQSLVMDITRIDDRQGIDADDDEPEYSPEHELDTQDGQEVIHIDPESMLHDAIYMINPEWDVSVVTDRLHEFGYGIRTSVDCGGGVLVYADLFVQNGAFRWGRVGHTDVVDGAGDGFEVDNIDRHTSSRVATHLIRELENSVRTGYATTVDSAATAFDFIATKTDIPPSGRRPPGSRELRETAWQKTWAEARGKTQQTVSDNVRSARSDLRGRLDNPSLGSRGPALEQIDPEGDEPGAIRLV